MGKRIFIFLLIILSLNCQKKQKSKRSIVTSTNVIESMVHYIAGDKYPVFSLLQAGENPHTKVLKPKEMGKAQNGIILFMIGLHLDEWALKIKDINPNIRLSILGKDLGVKNPHIWFSLEYVDTMVKRIVYTLSAIFQEDSIYFRQRGAKLERETKEVQSAYEKKFSEIKNKNVIAVFPVFNYMLKDMGCKIVKTIFQSPGEMPSARETADIIKIAKKEHINLIVSAPLPDGGITENIAKETGIRVVQLAPLLGFLPNTDDFIHLWKTNLKILYDGFSL